MSSELSHAFGFTVASEWAKDKTRAQTNAGCCFIDEANRTIALPVGRHVALQDFDSHTMSFLPHSQNVERVMSIACDPKQMHVAVCEKVPMDSDHKFVAQVSVFKVESKTTPKKARTLNHTFSQSESQNDFINATFSKDCKLLACCSGGHEPIIVMWDWARAKRVALCGGEQLKGINKLSFNPEDSTVLASSGKGHLHLWKLYEDTLKELSNLASEDFASANFTDHCWYDEEHLAVTTETGDLLVFAEQQLLFSMKNLHQTPSPQRPMPSLIGVHATGRGLLVVGPRDISILESMEQVGRKKTLQLEVVKKVRLDLASDLLATMVSPSGAMMACVLPSNVGFTPIAALSSQGLSMEDKDFDVAADSDQTPLSLTYPVLGHHGGSIASLDMCLRKPLLVTCCADDRCPALRIWNYRSRQCTILESFEAAAMMQPVCATFHPAGNHLLVGFRGRVRMYHLLLNQMRVAHEITRKGGGEVKFSCGGNVFSFVSGKGVLVYATYGNKSAGMTQPALLGSFQGHSMPAVGLAWKHSDLGLVSVSTDGAVYEWKLEQAKTGGRFKELVRKDIQYSAVTTSSEGCVAAAGRLTSTSHINGASGSQLSKRVDHGDSQHSRVRVAGALCSWTEHVEGTMVELLAPCLCTQLLLSPSDDLLYAGTCNGSVLVYRWPLQQDVECLLVEIPLQTGAITGLKLSPDGSTLFSAAEDGSLFMVELAESHRPSFGNGRVLRKKAEESGGTVVSDATDRQSVSVAGQEEEELVVIDRSTISDEKQKVLDLTAKVEEVKSSAIFIREADRRDHQEQLARIMAESNALSKAASKAQTNLEGELKKAKADSMMDMQNMEVAQNSAAKELESLYEQKLGIESQRYMTLKHEYDDLLVQTEERLLEVQSQSMRQHSQKLQQVQKQHAEDRKEQAQLSEYTVYIKQRYEEVLAQQEQEHEKEVMDLRAKLMQVQEEVALARTNSKSEMNVLQKSAAALQESLNSRETALREKIGENEDNQAIIKSLERETAGLQKQLEQEQARTREWKATATGHLRKGKELERMRQVLSHQLREMQQQAEPREQQLAEMQEQIRELDQEHERSVRATTNLDYIVSDKTNKMANLAAEARRLRKECSFRQQRITQFCEDLEAVVQRVQEKDWKLALLQLHETYVVKGAALKGKQRADPGSVDELLRQKGGMAKALSAMQRSKQLVEEKSRHMDRQRVQEASELLEDLNDLRHERHQLKQEVQRLKSRLGSGNSNANFSSSWDQQIQQQMDTVAKQKQALHKESPVPKSVHYDSRRINNKLGQTHTLHKASGAKSRKVHRGLSVTSSVRQLNLNKNLSHAAVLEGRLDEMERTCELQRREIQSLHATLANTYSQSGDFQDKNPSQTVQMPAIRNTSAGRASTAPGFMRESESAPLLRPTVHIRNTGA